MKADAALRGIGFNFGLPQTLAGAPDTLPIPDPANFGLVGQLELDARSASPGSATRTRASAIR